ncbi:MAG TPA: TetR/AcrR family transcriptional regulator, partial [Acidimicrobiales bacterium]
MAPKTPNPESSTTSAEPRPEVSLTLRRRSRARKGEGPRLRDEILDATQRLLLQTGSAEEVSIRGVADAVGITPPSIYRHFPDKQSLIYEVSERHFTTLEEEIGKAVAGIDDPVDALMARGRAYVRFGMANPEPYRVMFMTAPEGVPLDQQQSWLAHSKVFADTVEAVERCIEAGRFRPEHNDPFRVTLGFWARVHGLTSLAVSKPFLPIDDAFVE